MAKWPVGQRVRLSVTITDTSLAFVDPTTLAFKLKDPTGQVSTKTFGPDPEVVKDSVGHYHVDWTLNKPGKWFWRYEGTGNMNVAYETHELADVSAFYN